MENTCKLTIKIASFLCAFAILCISVDSSWAGGYIKADDDVMLYYEDVGEGTPIIFVPGWTGTTYFFSKQIDYFETSNSARAVVYDPRAQGRSSKTLDGAFYDQHAKDLKRLIEALDLKDVVLAGWSWGGVTVYDYLHQFGTDNLKGVVIIDQTPTPLSTEPSAWTDGGPDVVKQFFNDFTADRVETVRGFIPWMYTKGVSDEEASRLLAETMLTPDIVASQLLYDGWMVDWTETFKAVDVPMLMLVREENADPARSYIKIYQPEADIVVLGGHGMMWDHADQFNEAVSSFLGKLN
ncbi:MAG: alpha/beta hydrolase [Alphaproteobacteria bacterium]